MSHGDAPRTSPAPSTSSTGPYGGTCGGNGCIVFNSTAPPSPAPSSSPTATGTSSRCASAATGRTEIRKYDRVKGAYLPEVLHTEAGGQTLAWNWYEERDVRVPL
jgi:hypothetical protein